MINLDVHSPNYRTDANFDTNESMKNTIERTTINKSKDKINSKLSYFIIGFLVAFIAIIIGSTIEDYIHHIKLLEALGKFHHYLMPIIMGIVSGVFATFYWNEKTQHALSERILQESENKFKTIFYKNHSICLMIDPNTAKIIDANDTALNFYGYEYSEITALTVSQLSLLPEEIIKMEMKEAINNEQRYFTSTHVLKSGLIKFVEVYCTPITINDSLFLYSIIHDVTERKQAEALNKMLKHSMDVYTDGIYWMNNANEFVYVNDAGGKAFGCKPDELLGKSLYDVNPTTTPETLEDLWTKLRTNGTFTAETVHRKADGSEFYVEVRSVYFQYEGQEFNNGYARDITARKLAENELIKAKERSEESEKKLRNSEAILREAQKIALLGTWQFDIKNNQLNWSEEVYQIFDCDCDLFSPNYESFIEFVHAEDREKVNFSYSNSLNTKEDYEIEHRIITKNNELKFVNEKCRTEFDEYGNPNISYGIVTDISRHKLAEIQLIEAKEKAEESDRLKSAFLQNMSHEVRTPLNSIVGFSQLLKKSFHNPDKLEKFVGMISKSSDKLIGIITDIIEISQIQANQIHIKLVEFDFISLIKKIVDNYSQIAVDKSLVLNLNLNGASKECIILSDKEKLHKIFSHLIDNAIKFTSSGSVDMNCRLKDGVVEISIADTGIGIAKEMHEIIFETFRQVELGIIRNFGGNGLGLPIVRAYIQMLDGTITLDSELNKGTTFIITIPIKKGNTNWNEKSSNTEKSSIKKVLIAEDEFTNYLYLAELLNEFGFKIIHALNGQKALDMAMNDYSIDLIFMDIKMPVMDGHTAAKMIKEFRPNLPIIAQSAYALDHEIEMYNEIFDDYVIKPIEDKILKAKLAKYMNSN